MIEIKIYITQKTTHETLNESNHAAATEASGNFILKSLLV